MREIPLLSLEKCAYSGKRNVTAIFVESLVVTFLQVCTKTNGSGAVLGSQTIANAGRVAGRFVTIHDEPQATSNGGTYLRRSPGTQEIHVMHDGLQQQSGAASGLLPH